MATMAVIDANMLVFMYRAGIRSSIENCLRTHKLQLHTIQSVMRSELQDKVRIWAESLQSDEFLIVLNDPFKDRNSSKAVRKLIKRVERISKNRPLSQVDKQLLLLAIQQKVPLLTEEGPLSALSTAQGCLVLDEGALLRSLRDVGCISATELNRVLDEEHPTQKLTDTQLDEKPTWPCDEEPQESLT